MSIVTLDNRICEIGGGKMLFSVNSDHAECENCGHTADADPDSLAKVRKAYRNAESKMHLNTEDGYNEAISRFQALDFIKEAKGKAELCENRLSLLKEDKARREKSKEESDKTDTRIGILFLILFLLVLALAIAGLVYIIYHIKMGDLSPTATAVIIAVVAIFAVSVIIGKIKS